jgi:chorismate lyase / 3-hydroxybenzoate synthase
LNRPRIATGAVSAAPPHMEYRRLRADEPLPASTLCAISFGTGQPAPAGSSLQGLHLHVNLQPLVGAGITELWHAEAAGGVETGEDDLIRAAACGRHLAGMVEIDERAAGGLAAAAHAAYAAIGRFTLRSGHRHLLRMYNYFSDINEGTGDTERYKQFCSGRAAGLRELPEHALPAATAIGRRDHSAVLQVYWLACSEPGRAIENPRQVSAFRYPRQYGPSPPSFSRAMQVGGGLLVSGTASVLGHASRHPDNLPAQLDEILRNLTSLRRAAGGAALLQTGRGTLLKIYLREAAAAGFVSDYLRARLPAPVQLLVLAADICRRELLVEVDAAHLGTGG